jgi:hypothetical protein
MDLEKPARTALQHVGGSLIDSTIDRIARFFAGTPASLQANKV